MKTKFYNFKLLFLCLLILQGILNSCKSTNHNFAKGADIGWLPQMEATGFKFFDKLGQEKDCLLLLKEKGINSVRLRVWVNPNDHKTDGHCSKEETVILAQRAKKLNMKVMINFHYSDSWADPGKQTKPKAWKNHSFSELLNDVYNHTFEVVLALKTSGVTPDWVQIGNEIPGGMLWPDGSTNNWEQLGQLLNKGFEAVKSIDSKIKVIVHIDEGNNHEKLIDFFDNATKQNVKYDIIGLSYYPFWVKKDYTETINDLEFNLHELEKRYNKDVMIVEVGGEDDKVQNTFNLLEATIKAVKKVPNQRGKGVFYWEPQGAKSWSGYSLSAWQSDGKPSPALDAFLKN